MGSLNAEAKLNGKTFGRFRRILAQLIATSAASLLTIDAGLALAIPAIVISATTIHNEHNANETIIMTAIQTSWIASIGYLIQPIGSLVSAYLCDKFGRKKTMLVINIPFVIGWLLLYSSTEIWTLLVGLAVLGFSIGLIDAPNVTFIGEICEPSTRGVLLSFSNIFETIGIFVIFFLNTMIPWRIVGLVCLLVPVITMIALYFIPESPQWLLSKDCTKDAEKSLCWLRGWVSNDAVAQEFTKLQRHNDRSNSHYFHDYQNPVPIKSSPTLREKMSEFKRSRTLKPLIIIISLCFVAQFSGIMTMRSYIVQIFTAYEVPMQADKAAAMLTFSDNLANIIFICAIRFAGKRRLYLIMCFGTFLSSFVITCYGFIYLPSGYTSFDQSSHFQLENKLLGYIPLFCILSWSFFSYAGLVQIPWIFVSELFSFKVRVTACGFVAVFNYLIGFISRKTYQNLEILLSMPGVSLFYCVLTGVGLIEMYYILPETEDCTLEDIELNFSDKSKKITDWKITKTRERI